MRVLCGAIASAAARHGRGVSILHAVSARHFVKALARVERGARAADAAMASVGMATTPAGA